MPDRYAPLELKRPFVTVRTRLEDIPREWLLNIEAHVLRGSKRFGDCWIWQGQSDNGRARMYRSATDEDGGKARKNVCARRFIAHIFWDFEDTPFYIRNSCKNNLCVNPAHIRVTTSHHMQDDVD